MDAGFLKLIAVMVFAALGGEVKLCASRVGGEIHDLLELVSFVVLMLVEVDKDIVGLVLCNKKYLNRLSFAGFPLKVDMNLYAVGLRERNLFIISGV